jgi:hypothetical protein
MASGPSKEELEIYWQNSRQYFDELARHYQKADPEYYKDFIQPFYSNPFRSSSQGKSGSGGAKLVAVMAVVTLIGIAAASFFLFMSNVPEDKPERLNEKVTSDTITKQNITEPPPEVETDTEKSVHFRRGEKLFEDKNYALAERYLKKVPASDKNYEDAQRVLEIIKTMNNAKEQNNSRDKRVKPIQPVR